MDRLDRTFREPGKKLIIYLTAGYPSPGADEELAHCAIEAGADILELGFPFSDPVADGPLIQEASRVALENGMSLRGTLALAGRIRKRKDTPLILMGYVNPVYRMGYGTFSQRAADEGVDGIIVPDLPMEESGPLKGDLHRAGISLIPMAAPTTPPARVERLLSSGSGFLYLVSMTGLTGDAIASSADWKPVAASARDMGKLPVCLGFGIRHGRDAAEVVGDVNGVVVGSAVTRVIMEAGSPDAALRSVDELIRELASAVNSG
ncbi:MAG: tryptophan synthase subunit alpha [bacterium]|nr:MAG: tryptophan synthase subunit alpha [bacterium]